MVTPAFLLLLCLTALLAYGVRGATGAASAIVANTVLAFVITSTDGGSGLLHASLYWVAFADCLAAWIMFAILRSSIVVETIVIRFLAFSLPASIAFTLILPSLTAPVLAFTLGLVLVGAGGYLTFRPTPRQWTDRSLRLWAGPTGLTAGIFGGLFGMAGPIMMLFFSRAGGDPSTFRRRATLLSVVTSSVRLAVLVTVGAVGAADAGSFAVTIPFILGGLAIGFRVHRHVSSRRFWMGLGLIVGLAGFGILVRVAT